MVSQTIADILKKHQTNQDLISEYPGVVAQGELDLAADTIAAPIDEQVIAIASQALDDGHTHYVDVPGIAPLRDAIAAYLNQQYGSKYVTGNILITAGMQESRFLTIQKVSEEFDNKVAVPEVIHPGVRKAIGMRPRDVTPIGVDLSISALPSVENIKVVLQGGQRLLYLESPSRLTGEAYNAEAVAAIQSLAADFDATVIWDEGLAPWVASGSYTSLVPQGEADPHILAIGEAFPGMGLESWFVGFIATPENLVPAMQSQKQIMAICTSTATQYAALGASEIYAQQRVSQQTQMASRRSKLLELAAQTNLEAISGDAVNILAFRLPTGEKANLEARLHSAGYRFADGAAFGAPNVVRVTVSHTTEQAIQELV